MSSCKKRSQNLKRFLWIYSSLTLLQLVLVMDLLPKMKHPKRHDLLVTNHCVLHVKTGNRWKKYAILSFIPPSNGRKCDEATELHTADLNFSYFCSHRDIFHHGDTKLAYCNIFVTLFNNKMGCKSQVFLALSFWRDICVARNSIIDLNFD